MENPFPTSGRLPPLAGHPPQAKDLYTRVHTTMVDNRKRRRGMGLISLLSPSDWITVFKQIRKWLKYWRFPSIVYYIPPTVAHNDYYARLQIALETEIDKINRLGNNVWWRYRPPLNHAPSYIYARLEEVLKEVRPCDLIVMVPKGLHDPQTETRVRKWLTKCPSARIVFLDQLPPEGFLHDERCSFVGVDNRKVGILAAFALHERLGKADEYKYCVVKGPGGDVRFDGFVEGVRFFDSNTDVDCFDIGDVDRLERLAEIRAYIQDYTPATLIGIFAGNDETATAAWCPT